MRFRRRADWSRYSRRIVARVQTAPRSAASALRVLEALRNRPVLSVREASRRQNLTFPTAAKGMETLVGLGIAREVTGRQRNRLYVYDRYLAILQEGTEPL